MPEANKTEPNLRISQDLTRLVLSLLWVAMATVSTNKKSQSSLKGHKEKRREKMYRGETKNLLFVLALVI